MSYLVGSREVNLWGFPNSADLLSVFELLWNCEAFVDVQFWVDYLQPTTFQKDDNKKMNSIFLRCTKQTYTGTLK